LENFFNSPFSQKPVDFIQKITILVHIIKTMKVILKNNIHAKFGVSLPANTELDAQYICDILMVSVGDFFVAVDQKNIKKLIK